MSDQESYSVTELRTLAAAAKARGWIEMPAIKLAALANMLAYYESQDGLLSKAQDECQALRDEMAEIKRPLDAQMARLNRNVVAANERVRELERELSLARKGLT